MKDKSQQWWRWLLFIPAGVLSFLISVPISRLINYFSTIWVLGFANGILFKLSQIIVELLMLYLSAVIAAKVSPNEKIGGIIYSSVMLLVFGASIVLAIMQGQNWVYYVTTLGSIVVMIQTLVAASKDELGR